MEFEVSTLLLALIGICLIVFVVMIVWIFDPILHLIKPKRNSGKFNEDDNLFYFGKKKERISNSQNIINNPAVIDISLVVPAYNESSRIKAMLDPALPFLKQWCKKEKLSYEVIIVDDKSTDNTIDVVSQYMLQGAVEHNIRLLALKHNLGKGGAVKQGVRRARGRYILMVDADGATDINDLDKLFHELLAVKRYSKKAKDDIGMSVGSRAHMREANAKAKRSFSRSVLTTGFAVLVSWLCTKNIRDTQCGFKLFTRQTARILFRNLHLESWAFDTEIIYLAELLRHPIAEVSVNWREVDGSKLIQSKMDVVTTSLAMARDMLCVRLSYLLGIWKYVDC